MKTAILLHGYDANEQNRDYVVWGVPPDKPGRIPTAVAAALEEDAECLVIFGSSVEKKTDAGMVWSSGRWMEELLRDRWEELKAFSVLPVFQSFSQKQISNELDRMFRLIEEPDKPKNTMEELQAMARLLHEKHTGIQKLICVSSRDHISRIIRDAHIVFEGSPLAANLSVRGSITLYTENDGKTPSERAKINNVVVAEPRAPVVPYFQRMFGISGNAEALSEIDAVLNKYGK